MEYSPTIRPKCEEFFEECSVQTPRKLVIVANFFAERLRGRNGHDDNVHRVGDVRDSPQPTRCVEESASGA